MTKNVRPLILITGGAGYVGSTLIRDALSQNYSVRCLDLLIYGGRSIIGFLNHPSFELIKGDVRKLDDVERALENVDAVIHLAAVVGDLPCQVAPKSAYQINFQGTQLLVDCARKKGISWINQPEVSYNQITIKLLLITCFNSCLLECLRKMEV